MLLKLLNLGLDVDVARMLRFFLQTLHKLDMLLIALLLKHREVLVLPCQLELLHILGDR